MSKKRRASQTNKSLRPKKLVRRSHLQRHFKLEQVENRIMLAADIDLLETFSLSTVQGELVDQKSTQRADDLVLDQNQLVQSNNAQTQQSNVVVFIDAGVQDQTDLIQNLKAARPALQTARWIPLSGDQNGIFQISQHLRQLENVDAIHVLAHGEPSKITLGNSVLSSATLQANRRQIQAWSQSLSPKADILIYGCDVAEGAAGIRFVKRLANVTGADIAASNNRTGANQLGGDATLEVQSGKIESASILAGIDYPHVLANPTDGPDSISVSAAGTYAGLKGDDVYVFAGSWNGAVVEELKAAGVDTLDFSGVSQNLTFRIRPGHKVEVTDGTKTLKAAYVERFKMGSGQNLVIVEKGAELDSGAVIGNTSAGSKTIVSFTPNVANPDALFTANRTSKSVRAKLTNANDKLTVAKAAFDQLTNVDQIIGGKGADVLEGDASANHFTGGRGADTLRGTNGANTLQGGSGNDRIFGGSGADAELSGGDGDDLIDAGDGADGLVTGGSGDDTIYGGAGNDNLQGDAGDDLLIGEANNDTLAGGGGDDLYEFRNGWGVDVVTEADVSGTDTLDFSQVTETLAFTLGSSSTSQFLNVSNAGSTNRVTATNFIEAILAPNAANSYTVSAEFAANFEGDGLFDKLRIENPVNVSGLPQSTIDLSAVTVPLEIVIEPHPADASGNQVTISFDVTGIDPKIVITNVSSITGGTQDDTIVIKKDARIATLDGGAGNNQLRYEKHVNTDTGQIDAADAALIDSEVKTHASFTSWTADGVKFTVGAANHPNIYSLTNITSVVATDDRDAMFGSADAETLDGSGDADVLFGKAGNDTLMGGSGGDYVDGGAGDDQLHGDAGDDVLRGGANDDSISGGTGDDWMEGGAGNDTLTGGWGADIYSFQNGWGRDEIQSDRFARQNDTLDFHAVTDPLTISVAGGEINAGTGVFTRTSHLSAFDRATGNFDDPTSHTVKVTSPVGADFDIGTIKTGVGDQTLVIGNRWSDLVIDAAATTGNLLLDFSGATVPLRFSLVNDDQGKLELKVEKLDDITNLSLNALKDVIGNATSIRIINFDDTKTTIKSSRFENYYRANVGTRFRGTLSLTSGLQWRYRGGGNHGRADGAGRGPFG
ncbi:MAG: DUF4347 domain-containing protein [Planctomycetales bacterium]|nr:DUF4347 domain-containing protein [Planctomycetales bacterium]